MTDQGLKDNTEHYCIWLPRVEFLEACREMRMATSELSFPDHYQLLGKGQGGVKLQELVAVLDDGLADLLGSRLFAETVGLVVTDAGGTVVFEREHIPVWRY